MKGKVKFIVSVEIDTGDNTPRGAVLEELASSRVLLAKEVVIIEPPTTVGVYSPQLEEVR
jgi:hypothetical protein